MARKFFRRFMPHPDRIRKHRMLARVFGVLMHKPNLWHLNRHSVSRAFGFGLFWAFIPMPFQMIPAAALCIRFNGNLPLSLALVWLTNPLTMPPLMYAQYHLGRLILRTPSAGDFQFTWEAMQTHFHAIWQPLYLGAIVSAVVVSGMAYVTVSNLWRWHLIRRYRRRLHRRGLAPGAS